MILTRSGVFTFLVLLFLLLNSFIAQGVSITSQQNGDWDETSSWDLGRLPVNGDSIIINHAIDIPNNVDITLNGVIIIVNVSLDLVNRSGLYLDNASVFYLSAGATVSRATGNGKLVIGTTDLHGSGNGLIMSGVNVGDLTGWQNPLPVTLINFTAELNESGSFLNWQTSSEINNDYFEVQRKQIENWEVVGEVQGYGTVNELQNYEFSDLEVNIYTPTYYRLRQVDFDGNESMSNIVTVKPFLLRDKKYSFSRNGNKLDVVFSQSWLGYKEISIIGSDGKIIESVVFDSANSDQFYSFDISKCKSNWFILGVIGEESARFEKMLLLKE